MKRKLLDISKVTGDPRLNANLTRMQLFMNLLNLANEQGELLFNASEYSKSYRIERTAMSRLLDEMVENGYIAKNTQKGRLRITICDYDYYIVTWNSDCVVAAKDAQRIEEGAEENEKQEKKSSPYNPFIKEEKEKKEKSSLSKNNKKNNWEKSCVDDTDNLFNSSDNQHPMNAKVVLKLQQTPIDERKKEFWQAFYKSVLESDSQGKNLLHRLKEWMVENDIKEYFSTKDLMINFIKHWTQEVGMYNAEGEEVGTVMLRETRGRWDLWQQLTSFVQKGYELKQESDARKTIRENKLAVSKAQMRTSVSISQKAHAQAIAAKNKAGMRDETTEIENWRLEVGFDEFMDLFQVKANQKIARKEWKQLGMDDKIKAITYASAYCSYCRTEGVKMVQPDTYLKNARWDDKEPKDYRDYYEEDVEELVNKAIKSIKDVYAEIDAELDKKFEEKPEKRPAEDADAKANEAARIDLRKASA